MTCRSESTCWRHLRDWQESGVWKEPHRVLLNRLGEADRIDWERASLDSASVPAKRAPLCVSVSSCDGWSRWEIRPELLKDGVGDAPL
jgi:hypothetical protein